MSATICLGASKIFYPYFPHFLTDMGEIWYRKFLSNVIN